MFLLLLLASLLNLVTITNTFSVTTSFDFASHRKNFPGSIRSNGFPRQNSASKYIVSMASSTDRHKIYSRRSKNLDVERNSLERGIKRKNNRDRRFSEENIIKSLDDMVKGTQSIPKPFFPMTLPSYLLNSEEEIALARQVQIGVEWMAARNRLEERLQRPPTSAEWAANMSVDEDTLKIIMIRAEQAKITMVSSNMRFAAHVANRYRYTGLTMSDLLQEASNGLMKAAEKFNPDRGFKFSTYSIWWIRQCIFRAIAKQSRTIRLPSHAHDLDYSIRRATKELTCLNDRPPTDEELAVHLNVSERRIAFFKLIAKSAMSMEQTRHSVNGLEEKSENTLSHVMSDNEPEPDESTQDCMLKDNVFELLETLNPREQEVMRLRYGLDDGNEHTLEEVGNAFCVTRERVRQIETRALQKLRQPYRNKKLRPFFHREEDFFTELSSFTPEYSLHEYTMA